MAQDSADEEEDSKDYEKSSYKFVGFHCKIIEI